MKVLVTGASGFLGGYLVARLVAEGYSVRALVRRVSNTRHVTIPGVELVRGDVKEPEDCRRAVAGVDAVVHAAAAVRGGWPEYEATTVRGTEYLIRLAREAGVRKFVHISSISVLRMSRPRGVLCEDAPYEDRLLTQYSKSKLLAEKAVVRFAREHDYPAIVLRPGLIYGPRGKWFQPRIGYSFGAGLFVMVGAGANPLPLVYVENLVEAIVCALRAEVPPASLYNIVDDQTVTQAEYMRRCRRMLFPGMRVVRFPYAAWRLLGRLSDIILARIGRASPFGRPQLHPCGKHLTYGNSRAHRDLGWSPPVGVDEALRRTFGSMRARRRPSRRNDLARLGRLRPGGRPMRAGVIGCGGIASAHLDFLRDMPNVEIAALCDTNAEAAHEMSRRYGASAVYLRPEDMFAAGELDVVHILTPPQSHAGLVEMAASAGSHILVEKPMGVAAADALRMARTAEEHGVGLCVGHCLIFDPLVVRTRAIIESGALGRILWIDSYYGFDLGSNPNCRYMAPGGGDHWTFDLPGGLFQNLAPHPFSIMLDLLGVPDEVHATATYGRILPHGSRDELRVMVRKGEAAGLVTVSLAAAPRHQYLIVYGTGGALRVDLLNQWLSLETAGGGLPKPIARAMFNLRYGRTMISGTLRGMVKVLTRRWSPFDGMGILIREFYNAVADGAPPPVTAADGIRVMELMDETWRQIGPLTPDE